jgi:hypothetical protein
VYQDISDKINAVDFTNRVNQFLNSSVSDNETDPNEVNVDKISRLSSAHTSYHDLPSSFNENMKTEKLNALSFSPNGGASSTNNRHNDNTANTSMTNVTKYEPESITNSSVYKHVASSNLIFDSKSKNSYTNGSSNYLSSNNNVKTDNTTYTVRFDDKSDIQSQNKILNSTRKPNLNNSFELKSSFSILKTPCCNDIVKTVETTSFLPSSFNENFLLRKTTGCGNFGCSGTDPLLMDKKSSEAPFYSSTMSMPSKRATHFSCSYEPKLSSNLDDPFVR